MRLHNYADHESMCKLTDSRMKRPWSQYGRVAEAVPGFCGLNEALFLSFNEDRLAQE